jgi:hypothetical protein
MDEKLIDRCESHNLAVGPDGMCVLCRREGGVEPATAMLLPSRSRLGWIVGVLAASCLGVAFLGGVALARGHRAGPVADARPAQAPAIDERPVGLPPDETPPRLVEPVQTVREPAPTPPPLAQYQPPPQPQRNYLDEAYAGIDKRGLYDTGSSGRAACTPVVVGAPAPRYYYGRGYGTAAGYGVGAGTGTGMRVGNSVGGRVGK